MVKLGLYSGFSIYLATQVEPRIRDCEENGPYQLLVHQYFMEKAKRVTPQCPTNDDINLPANKETDPGDIYDEDKLLGHFLIDCGNDNILLPGFIKLNLKLHFFTNCNNIFFYKLCINAQSIW